MQKINFENAYDRIIANMQRYPSGIPTKDGRVSEAFREYIQLMFTPEEAEIAQYMELRLPPAGRLPPWVLYILSPSPLGQKKKPRKTLQ